MRLRPHGLTGVAFDPIVGCSPSSVDDILDPLPQTVMRLLQMVVVWEERFLLHAHSLQDFG